MLRLSSSGLLGSCCLLRCSSLLRGSGLGGLGDATGLCLSESCLGLLGLVGSL